MRELPGVLPLLSFLSSALSQCHLEVPVTYNITSTNAKLQLQHAIYITCGHQISCNGNKFHPVQLQLRSLALIPTTKYQSLRHLNQHIRASGARIHLMAPTGTLPQLVSRPTRQDEKPEMQHPSTIN